MPTTFTLNNKTALVTGGAKRIGKAISLALADEGANVIVHYNTSAQQALDACREIEERGARAWALQADLTDPSACDRLAQECLATAGEVRVLINSASTFTESRLEDLTLEQLTRNMQLHAMAPLQLARALMGNIADQDTGRVINLLDSYVTRYQRRFVGYNLSKRALLTLTRMLALELAPRVTVNGVAPGFILPAPGQDLESFKRLSRANPLQRVGAVEDIVDAVMYLLRAGFVTGQVLFVDGGASTSALP